MGGEQKQKQKQQQQQKQGRNAGGKKGGAEGGRDAQQKAEMEPPQAIVIADPFCNRFEAVAPTPSVMLPLASSATPLIDNTLEMLRRAGISDIVVACGKDTLEPVAAHVEELQRGRHEHIKMVNCPKAFSVGDLLREVFSRQLISSKVYVIVCDALSLFFHPPSHTLHSSPLTLALCVTTDIWRCGLEHGSHQGHQRSYVCCFPSLLFLSLTLAHF